MGARRLRRDQTPAERKFWGVLHPFREQGWHFRRQCPIGPYIVDFVCKKAGLVFEIDGDTHHLDGAAERDAIRTTYLVGRGYRVIRFTNEEVYHEDDGVFLRVEAELRCYSADTPT